MVEQRSCILYNITSTGKGKSISEALDDYCCNKLVKNTGRAHTKKFRRSLGGLLAMHSGSVKFDKWLKRCPYCNAKVKLKMLRVPFPVFQYLSYKDFTDAINDYD